MEILNSHTGDFILHDEIKSSFNENGEIGLAGYGLLEEHADSEKVVYPYVSFFNTKGENIFNEIKKYEPGYKAIDVIHRTDQSKVILCSNGEKSYLNMYNTKQRPVLQFHVGMFDATYNGLELTTDDKGNLIVIGTTTFSDSLGEDMTTLFEYEIRKDTYIPTTRIKLIPMHSGFRQYNYHEGEILQVGDFSVLGGMHGIPFHFREVFYSYTTAQAIAGNYYKYDFQVSEYPRNEYGFNIYPYSDTSYLVIGCAGGFSSSRGTPFLVEVNDSNDFNLSKNLVISSHTNTVRYSQAFKVDGGWLFGAIVGKYNKADALAMKLIIEKKDEDLNFIWTEEFDYSGGDYRYKIEELDSANYILYGYNLLEDSTLSFISIDERGKTSAGINQVAEGNIVSSGWKMKLDASGNRINFNRKDFTQSAFSMKLLNTRGQIVKQHKESSLSKDLSIDLSGLSRGAYIVQYGTGNRQIRDIITLK